MADKLKVGLMAWDDDLYRILTKKGVQNSIRNKKLVCEIVVDDAFALDIFYNTKQILSTKSEMKE